MEEVSSSSKDGEVKENVSAFVRADKYKKGRWEAQMTSIPEKEEEGWYGWVDYESSAHAERTEEEESEKSKAEQVEVRGNQQQQPGSLRARGILPPRRIGEKRRGKPRPKMDAARKEKFEAMKKQEDRDDWKTSDWSTWSSWSSNSWSSQK